MHAIIRKFLADRGTHLAAMIAYFAILAFVPLLFLALSLLAFAGEQDESSYLIEELRRAFPENSVENILDAVTEIQEQATELSVIGGIGLLWAALGFFSVLESAFNIVYGLPNRPFIRQKTLVLLLTAASLVVLFLALVISSVGVELASRAGVAEGVLSYVYALLVSTALLVSFTWSLYRLLTNTSLSWRETLPGALFASVLLQASFQVLPTFVRLSNELIALQAYGGLVLLLVWLYVMANILVLGAEVNWWLTRGRSGAPTEILRLDLARLRRARALLEHLEHLLLDVGMVVDEASEGLAREDEEADGRRGGHGRGAPRRLPDQRDLAEEVARTEPADLLARPW